MYVCHLLCFKNDCLIKQYLLGFGRGQVSPVWIVIFISTELLVLRDRKRSQTFNLTFWFYFIIILIINVEMTELLLGTIFGAKVWLKKMSSAWLLLKTWINYLLEMNRTLLSIYTNQLLINILFPVFTFWRKWKPLKLKDNSNLSRQMTQKVSGIDQYLHGIYVLYKFAFVNEGD